MGSHTDQQLWQGGLWLLIDGGRAALDKQLRGPVVMMNGGRAALRFVSHQVMQDVCIEGRPF